MWFKFKWDMFVTSFIPLWIAIIVFDLWDIIEYFVLIFSKDSILIAQVVSCLSNNLIQVISIVAIIIMVMISTFGIYNFLKVQERSCQKSRGSILNAKKANKLSSEFLLAYILPLVAFDFSDLKSLALFLTYFIILAFLCIRNNNIYTNILLEFMKYRMYFCDIECPLPGNKSIIYYDSLIISKDDLTAMENMQIAYWDCDNYIYIHVKEMNNNE